MVGSAVALPLMVTEPCIPPAVRYALTPLDMT